MSKQKKPLTPAQRRAPVEQALAAYQKQAADLTSAEKIAEILKDESDRGVVTTYVSFIEDTLVDRVVEKLGIPPDSRKKLTKGSGALSNVYAVTDLAVALDLIPPSIEETLAVLRMMRNACAHCRREINLQTPELRDALVLLFEDQGGNADKLLLGLNRTATRDIFIVMCGSVLSTIANEASFTDPETHLRRAVAVVQKLRSAPAPLPRRRRSPVSHETPETS